jgi:hypothetical protein
MGHKRGSNYRKVTDSFIQVRNPARILVHFFWILKECQSGVPGHWLGESCILGTQAQEYLGWRSLLVI